ncbi:hypothetical protein M3484_17945 [Pseudomonas sp. GX19020]|uniref:hypothetical protein n=1 Tax=Pseudomonas sp. GX19020 TaxID=2942277 RepID=UPI002018F994|nr:hypothetical protein [Pseudomonas sp. GX19020]MCL4068452.1 hypothetical protein [Pseudomonas sp. GX19020]
MKARNADLMMEFVAAFRDCSLVAILCGIRPEEALAHVDEVAEAGLTLIEALSAAFETRAIIGSRHRSYRHTC